jgi:hypothetical protein
MQQFEDGPGEGKSAIFGVASSETGQNRRAEGHEGDRHGRNYSDGANLAIVTRAAGPGND